MAQKLDKVPDKAKRGPTKDEREFEAMRSEFLTSAHRTVHLRPRHAQRHKFHAANYLGQIKILFDVTLKYFTKIARLRSRVPNFRFDSRGIPQ